jgi:hypothetical protein
VEAYIFNSSSSRHERKFAMMTMAQLHEGDIADLARRSHEEPSH